MGRDPLEENQDTAKLRNWLIRAGKTRLFDISSWDRWGDWADWDFTGIPERLTHQKNILIESLDGANPENRRLKDRWA